MLLRDEEAAETALGSLGPKVDRAGRCLLHFGASGPVLGRSGVLVGPPLSLKDARVTPKGDFGDFSSSFSIPTAQAQSK